MGNRYGRPVGDSWTGLVLRDGRHPVVERMMPAGEFVPNDCDLSGSDAQIVILPGPNMAGKSTYLLGVALTVLMAQMGTATGMVTLATSSDATDWKRPGSSCPRTMPTTMQSATQTVK